MARIVSLVVLVAILLVIGGLFFRVMAGFLLPLFLALLLVVMFGPLYRWFRDRCRGHARVAAVLTTGSILLMVLVPLLLLLFEAGREARAIYHAAVTNPTLTDTHDAAVVNPVSADTKTASEPADAHTNDAAVTNPLLADEKAASKPVDAEAAISDATKLSDWATGQLIKLGNRLGLELDRKDLESSIARGVQKFLAPMALRTTQFFGDMIMSMAIMVLATYYFFADGPLMVGAILRLSPIEGSRTRELLDQFDSVTRSVVVATLLSAFVQGLLAGVGFYMAGVGSVFLLTVSCMLLTLVPFVGAALVWVPVCLWLYAVESHTTAAIVLAVYCIVVVSMVDNLVKPAVLHGRSNLHPLLALLSVLGGVQALGPIGIFVGPMVVAFLQTLLNMVHAELNSITKPTTATPR